MHVYGEYPLPRPNIKKEMELFGPKINELFLHLFYFYTFIQIINIFKATFLDKFLEYSFFFYRNSGGGS